MNVIELSTYFGDAMTILIRGVREMDVMRYFKTLQENSVKSAVEDFRCVMTNLTERDGLS